MLLAQFENFKTMFSIPELLVLHVGHVIVVSIFKCFHGASTISLLVFSYADDTIDDCEDDTDGGRYDLQLGLASERVTGHRLNQPLLSSL
jgi:hypothetical protein